MLSCCLAVGLSGCEELQQVIEEKVQEGVQDASPKRDLGSAEDASLSDEEKLARKLDLYVVCIDRSLTRIRSSWERYTDDIDPDTGLPRAKSGKPFLYAIGTELEPCREAAEKGARMDPPLPDIERATAAYLESGRRFADLSRTLHAYYERGDYADDAWAEGKRIAPEFEAAHTRWSSAALELRRLVSAKQDEVDQRMLVLIEQREGRSLRWHANDMVIEAKKFVACVEPPEATAEDCEDAFRALKAAHDGFRAYHDAHESAAGKVFWMIAYQGTVDEYLAEAEELMPKLRKRKPRDRMAALQPLLRVHDDLVSDYNNLWFDFP